MSSPSSDRQQARTSIVTVDDDPGVSRAVARDLRRRYGDTHRIVRAESGQQALDALREMKLRGDSVAVLLADYRMPNMNGLQFLEQAMDLYPGARRVLLTAYADTGAAIEAINVVDLDYYLLKPWDPPEEKLYPVIDAQLKAWASQRLPAGARDEGRRPPLVGPLVGGARVPRPQPGALPLLHLRDARRAIGCSKRPSVGPRDVPLVVTPDGTAMVAPTDSELAGHVGLSTTPSKDFYDLVVIGGGPAGLGSAVYGASEGLRTVLVERHGDRRAGRAELAHRELPRLPRRCLRFAADRAGPAPGDQVRRRADHHPRRRRARGATAPARTVRFADGGSIDAHTVILATGVSYRQLGATGLENLTGRGVFYGSALTEAANCASAGRLHRRRRELGRAGGRLPGRAARSR